MIQSPDPEYKDVAETEVRAIRKARPAFLPDRAFRLTLNVLPAGHLKRLVGVIDKAGVRCQDGDRGYANGRAFGNSSLITRGIGLSVKARNPFWTDRQSKVPPARCPGRRWRLRHARDAAFSHHSHGKAPYSERDA
jgi:hypothetical protein